MQHELWINIYDRSLVMNNSAQRTNGEDIMAWHGCPDVTTTAKKRATMSLQSSLMDDCYVWTWEEKQAYAFFFTLTVYSHVTCIKTIC